VAINRDANLTKLSASLNNYAVMLTDMGRRAEAVSISEEAFGLRRELAALNGEAYIPDYLQTVAVLGYVLVESDQFDEAIGPLVEALTILQDLPGPPQDIGGMVVNLLQRAFAGDPISVTSQFREITGQTVPAWMAEAPDAHN
jgi:tetratricopeptide (TPR) repeat protein